jgi:hypothetical protein
VSGVQASLFDFAAPTASPDPAEQLRRDERVLTSQGYRIVSVAEFNKATDVPEGKTREVVRQLVKRFGGDTVVYEPGGDDRYGWLLIGDDRAALARETVDYCCRGTS